MTAACPACTVDPLETSGAAADDGPAAVSLSLPTVHCAACIARVEKELNAMPGVREARVNLSLKRARVDGDADPAEMIERLNAIGYEAYALNEAALGAREDTASRAMLLLLVLISIFFMVCQKP